MAYMTGPAVGRLARGLGDRDRAILVDLARFKALTGAQLTRLHFADLAGDSRDRTRRRVLGRLVELQLAATLERPIGGVRAGSAGHVYYPGAAGQRLLPQLGEGAEEQATARVRTQWRPGTLFLDHVLAIAELYVSLRDHDRARELTLAEYRTEPASWHTDIVGGVLKPDAYVRVQHAGIEDCYWVEVDRATESLPALRKQLLAYTSFANSGQVGPHGIMPKVLLSVPHERRLAAVRDLVTALPTPGLDLILPALGDRAAPTMIEILRG